MGRSPCCDKVGLKKGPWTHEEDQKLVIYIQRHGHGSWRGLPAKAGLQRCGKSCRLRWINYLRPDIKRGKFSLEEEQTIIQLHALLGNRWSAIAAHLPKRTDNEIKNHWNTHLKKRLIKMGIDPITHKPRNHTLGSSLSHMAQWENARLEAEARLRCHSSQYHSQLIYTTNPPPLAAAAPPHAPATPCLDILNVWQGICYFNSIESLESPTAILNFPAENMFTTPLGFSEDFLAAYEIDTKTEHAQSNWTCIGNPNDISCPIDSTYAATLQAPWEDSQIFGLT